jgi:methyl-accepting chemotaxis protein
VRQGVEIVKDVQGREVLTAHAPILPLRWLMFVELPIEEAYAPLYEAIKRSSYLLLGGLTLAFLAGLFLARKMIIPIQQLRLGAAQNGAGKLEQRISIKTGDELELLADQFNDMAAPGGIHAGLEQKVDQRNPRTERIARAADGDPRCSVISSSPGDLEPFSAMLENACVSARHWRCSSRRRRSA